MIQSCTLRTPLNPSRRLGASDVKVCIPQYTYELESQRLTLTFHSNIDKLYHPLETHTQSDTNTHRRANEHAARSRRPWRPVQAAPLQGGGTLDQPRALPAQNPTSQPTTLPVLLRFPPRVPLRPASRPDASRAAPLPTPPLSGPALLPRPTSCPALPRFPPRPTSRSAPYRPAPSRPAPACQGGKQEKKRRKR